MRQAIRAGLLSITEIHAIIAAIAQQATKTRQIIRGGNNEDIPDPRQHEHGDRIIHHRLIEDRQQLLADAFGDGVESGAGSTGQYDAFHSRMYFISHLPSRAGNAEPMRRLAGWSTCTGAHPYALILASLPPFSQPPFRDTTSIISIIQNNQKTKIKKTHPALHQQAGRANDFVQPA